MQTTLEDVYTIFANYYTDGPVTTKEVEQVLNSYIESLNDAKPIVRSPFPAFDGFDEWLKGRYEFTDGDWYHVEDTEGQNPTSTLELLKWYVSGK